MPLTPGPYTRAIVRKEAYQTIDHPHPDAWSVALHLECRHVVRRKLSQCPRYYVLCEKCKAADKERRETTDGPTN